MNQDRIQDMEKHDNTELDAKSNNKLTGMAALISEYHFGQELWFLNISEHSAVPLSGAVTGISGARSEHGSEIILQITVTGGDKQAIFNVNEKGLFTSLDKLKEDIFDKNIQS